MAETNRPEHRPADVDPHDLHKGVPSGPPGDPDRDVNTKMIWRVAIGLAVGTVVSGALMLLLFQLEKSHLQKADPAPSPIAEGRAPQAPPGPLLQNDPPADMQAFRAAEEKLLGTYGWTDQADGVARIPVTRAMDVVVSQGLAPLPALPAPEPAVQPPAESAAPAEPAAAQPAAPVPPQEKR